MSTTLFPDDTLFTQRLLKAEGLYTGSLDGIWGPLTEKAANAFEQQSREIAAQYGTFDLRSEQNIATLSLHAQQQARQFMTRVQRAMQDHRPADETAAEHPIVKIISGTRSYEEQNKLFRQGRYHNPGPIITNARGGRSGHNFGVAWDIGIFSENKGYIPGGLLYDEAAKAGLDKPLEWGGNWPHFVDKPHYQLKMTAPMYVVRRQFEAGEFDVQPA